MAGSAATGAGPDPSSKDADFTILDTGVPAIAAAEIRRAVRCVQDGEAIEVARDRNSICFRVPLAVVGQAPEVALIKVPRAGPQRTNGDATFAGEAAIIARLPSAGITRAYRLLARVRADGSHFLLTTHVSGAHPDALDHPLDAPALAELFDSLFAMDCQGLMHYDLKPSNILFEGRHHGLIDFEFARFEPWHAAYAEVTADYCEDYNASPNPHFPARSNVANFEFRTLSAYLARLAQSTSSARADEFLELYLRAKSRYCARMGQFLAELAPGSVERLAAHAGLAVRDVRRRLGEAAAFSEQLGVLLRDAGGPVRALERALMDFRRDVFERRRDNAHRLRAGVFDRLRHEGAATMALPTAYLEAMTRTFDLVWRSR